MLQLGRNKQKVGLMINDYVIRCVELQGKHVVKTAHERYLPEGLIQQGDIQQPTDFQTILNDCVAAWGLKHKQVVFSVPDTYVVVRKETIPLDVDKDEITGYLYLEIGSSVHLPFDEPVFDYELLGEKNGKQELLLFASPEDVVTQYADHLEEANLKPVAADLSALALYRTYIADDRPLAEDEPLLLLEYDVEAVNLSIFRHHKPEFVRQLLLNTPYEKWEKTIVDEKVEALTWTEGDAFLEGAISDSFLEIERVMNFYRFTLHQGDLTFQKIVLTGDHPELDNVQTQLAATFDLPIERWSTLESADLSAPFFSAFGLAMKEV